MHRSLLFVHSNFPKYLFTIYLICDNWLLISLFALLHAIILYCRFPQVNRNHLNDIFSEYSTPVAHRGGASDAPENTISAIQYAKENGANAVEIDVSFTKDGVAVLMHDDSLERTTDGNGLVKDVTFSEIRKLNAAANDENKARFPFEKIPTLEEAVALSLDLGLNIYFDVKDNPKKSATEFIRLFKKYPALYRKSIVCSFHPEIIYKVRCFNAEISTALTWRPNFLSRTSSYGEERSFSFIFLMLMKMGDILLQWAHFNFLWFFIGNSACLLSADLASKDTVKHFQDRNIDVLFWTPNTKEEKAYITNHLKCIYITDSVNVS